MKSDDCALVWINGELESIPPLRELASGEFEDVQMIRDWRGFKFTNITKTRTCREPNDGHEWGYGGTGPTDFARDILLHFANDWDFAKKHANEFRDKFLASMPKEGGRAVKEAVLAFVAEKRAGRVGPILVR
jgi:hypothetical protein